LGTYPARDLLEMSPCWESLSYFKFKKSHGIRNRWGMKVFIQRKQTDLFLDREGNWVSGLANASDFKRALTALEFCLKQKEHDVWILLAFENDSLNVQLDPFKDAAKFQRNAIL
jgi:hypothetical protein